MSAGWHCVVLKEVSLVSVHTGHERVPTAQRGLQTVEGSRCGNLLSEITPHHNSTITALNCPVLGYRVHCLLGFSQRCSSAQNNWNCDLSTRLHVSSHPTSIDTVPEGKPAEEHCVMRWAVALRLDISSGIPLDTGNTALARHWWYYGPQHWIVLRFAAVWYSSRFLQCLPDDLSPSIQDFYSSSEVIANCWNECNIRYAGMLRTEKYKEHIWNNK